MRGAGGMNDQALGVAHVGEVPPQRQTLDEALACSSVALEIEREDRASAAWHVLLRQRVVWVVWQPSVAHTLDHGMRRQEARNALGVADVALHTHRQRFQPQGVEKR